MDIELERTEETELDFMTQFYEIEAEDERDETRLDMTFALYG